MFDAAIFVAFQAAALLTQGAPYAPARIEAVDGDSLKADGVLVRISNLDTPERGAGAACDAERMLAIHASEAAARFLAEGDIIIWPEGRADRYRRPLVRVTVGGADWADKMIGGNLAVRWEGKRHDWCAAGS